MKIRDSGMPQENQWDSYFDAPSILSRLEFPGGDARICDFGCGYGTFAVAAARLTTGSVYAMDIEPAMLEATALRAARAGCRNVITVARDVSTDGSGLPPGSLDYVMLFNVLHAENPVVLLAEALRALRPGGTVAIVHWIHDAATPRGPALAIRPTPEQCAGWAREAGFHEVDAAVLLPPHHYGLVARRQPRAHSDLPD